MATNKTGRPLSINAEVVKKLQESCEDGLSISEACFVSGISRPTYYRLLAVDKEFSYKMNGSQTSLLSKAKANIAKAVNKGDVSASKWLIERDDKNTKLDFDDLLPEELTLPDWVDGKDALITSKEFLVKMLNTHMGFNNKNKSSEFDTCSKEFIEKFKDSDKKKKAEYAIQFFSGHEDINWFIKLNLDSITYLTKKKPKVPHHA